MGIRKLVAGAALAALLASPVLADNTDTETVSVTGTVIASLELAVGNNATMPDIVVPATGEPAATVTLACTTSATTVSYTANGSPFANGSTSATAGVETGSDNAAAVAATTRSTGVCATLTVTGEADFNYVVDYTITQAAATDANVTLTEVTCIDPAGGTIADGGIANLGGDASDALRCGGTVNVAAGATAGAYTGIQYTVQVTYD